MHCSCMRVMRIKLQSQIGFDYFEFSFDVFLMKLSEVYCSTIFGGVIRIVHNSSFTVFG